MVRRLNFAVDLLDASVRPDQITDAGRILGIGGSRRTVSHAHRSICVAKQIVRKIKLILKRRVLFRGVTAQSDNDSISVVEFLGSITEPFAFDGSTGGVGFWIPPQNHILP